MKIAEYEQTMNSLTIFGKIDHLECNLITHGNTRKSPDPFAKMAQLAHEHDGIDLRLFEFGLKEDEVPKLLAKTESGKDYKGFALMSMRIALRKISLGFCSWQNGETLYYVCIPLAKTTGTLKFVRQEKTFQEKYSLTWQNGTLLHVTKERDHLTHTYQIAPRELGSNKLSDYPYPDCFISTECIDISRPEKEGA